MFSEKRREVEVDRAKERKSGGGTKVFKSSPFIPGSHSMCLRRAQTGTNTKTVEM
jgi:hypothetical protein